MPGCRHALPSGRTAETAKPPSPVGQPTASRPAVRPVPASRPGRGPARLPLRCGCRAARTPRAGPLGTRSVSECAASWSHRHADWRARRVLARVGQGLLDNPVGAHATAAGTSLSARATRPGPPYTPATRARSRRSAGRSASRRAVGRGRRASVAAQHAEQPPHVRHRLARRGAQRAELGTGSARSCRRTPSRGGLCPHRDHRHVVGNDVVHLAGDPGSLLEDGPPCLLQFDLLGLSQSGVCSHAPPGTRAVHRDHHARMRNARLLSTAVPSGSAAFGVSHQCHHGTRVSAHSQDSAARGWRNRAA